MQQRGAGCACLLVEEGARGVGPDYSAAGLIDDSPVGGQVEVRVLPVECRSGEELEGLFILLAQTFGGLDHGAVFGAGVDAAAFEVEVFACGLVPGAPAWLTGLGHFNVDGALV